MELQNSSGVIAEKSNEITDNSWQNMANNLAVTILHESAWAYFCDAVIKTQLNAMFAQTQSLGHTVVSLQKWDGVSGAFSLVYTEDITILLLYLLG